MQLIKGKMFELVKFGRDLTHHFFDAYFLDDAIAKKIHNDPGASFTSTHREGNRITKKAYPKGEEKLRDEISWYLLFEGTKFSSHLPKIYGYSLRKRKVFIEMKYYTYPNLRRIIFNGANTKFFIRMRLKHLLDALLKNLYVEKYSKKSPEDFVQKTHFLKLKQRIKEALEMAPFFKDTITSDYLTINGKKYANTSLIIPAIEKNDMVRALLKPDRLYYSHGDLHSNNILCGIMHNGFILIDCRGKSPYGDLFFDPAYDLAKLYHDFHSLYSLIENHSYSIFLMAKNNEIYVDYHFTNDSVKARFEYWGKYIDQLVREKFNRFGNIEYRARFTEALLYLTMVPFHLKTPSEGLMCYTTGIVRLNEWLEKNHKHIYKNIMKGAGR